jgi:hypothetical protein
MMSTLELRVTLMDLEPPVWRRILVPERISFQELHEIIQAVMGWENYYPYQFHVFDGIIGDLTCQLDPTHIIQSARSINLQHYNLEPSVKFHYIYNLGDWWRHEILVERICRGESYPLCTGGERSCPPEQIGGIWGFRDFLEALENPGDSKHTHMLQRASSGYDPEYFKLVDANRLLQSIWEDHL